MSQVLVCHERPLSSRNCLSQQNFTNVITTPHTENLEYKNPEKIPYDYSMLIIAKSYNTKQTSTQLRPKRDAVFHILPNSNSSIL